VGLTMWVEWDMNISWQGSFILLVVHRKNIKGVYNSYLKSLRHWNFSVFSFAQMIIKLNCWVVMIAHYSWCIEVLSAKNGSGLMKDRIIDNYPTLVISLVISIHPVFAHSPIYWPSFLRVLVGWLEGGHIVDLDLFSYSILV
jgi:hypothetical protein